MESRCLPWAPAHPGISCIHVPCSKAHSPYFQVMKFPFCPSVVSCTQMETQLGIWGWDGARCSCTVGSLESRSCVQLDSIQVAATGRAHAVRALL